MEIDTRSDYVLESVLDKVLECLPLCTLDTYVDGFVYEGSVMFDKGNNIFYGQLLHLHIDPPVTYTGDTLEDLYKNFIGAARKFEIDNYGENK